MIFLTIVSLLGGSYLLGRSHGYTRAEQHDQEAKSIWKEVNERGL
jgi:hypothetical protein